MAERTKDSRNSSKRALDNMKELQKTIQPYPDDPYIFARIKRLGKRAGQLMGKQKADALRKCCELLEIYRSAGEMESVGREAALEYIGECIDGCTIEKVKGTTHTYKYKDKTHHLAHAGHYVQPPGWRLRRTTKCSLRRGLTWTLCQVWVGSFGASRGG